MNLMDWKIAGALALMIVVISLSALAGDGQIDILPSGSVTFTISKSGSYVLTDNVTMTANLNCIEITADNVSLDLNGHTLVGMGTGSYGIHGSSADGATIRNGQISSFGHRGIYLGENSCVKDVLVTKCGFGLYLGDGALVSSVRAQNNSRCGIYTGNGAIVEKCVSQFNGAGASGSIYGIRVGDDSTVRDCSCRNNDTGVTSGPIDVLGILAGDSCIIINNVSSGNANRTSSDGRECYGILAGKGASIQNNVCSGNIALNLGTLLYGIYTEDNAIISKNNISKNEASGSGGNFVGVRTGKCSLVEKNICVENDASGVNSEATGILTKSQCTIRGNVCNDNNGKSISRGIYVGGSACRVEGNQCNSHRGETTGIGIQTEPGTYRTVVIGNSFSYNDDGLDLNGGPHYYAENMGTDDIINTAGATAGTGDRSNIDF